MGPTSGRTSGLQSSKYALPTDSDAGVSLAEEPFSALAQFVPQAQIHLLAQIPADLLPGDDIEAMDSITVERNFLESLMRQVALSGKGATAVKLPDNPTAWVALDDGKLVLHKTEYTCLLEDKIRLEQQVGQLTTENNSLKSEVETLREVIEKTLGKSRATIGVASPRQSTSGISRPDPAQVNPSPTITEFAEKGKNALTGPKAIKSRSASTAGSNVGGSNGDALKNKAQPKPAPINTGGGGKKKGGAGQRKNGSNGNDWSSPAELPNNNGWSTSSVNLNAPGNEWNIVTTTAATQQDVGWRNEQSTLPPQDDGWRNPSAISAPQDNSWDAVVNAGSNDAATLSPAQPINWADHTAEAQMANWDNPNPDNAQKMSSWDYTPPLEPQGVPFDSSFSAPSLPPPAVDSWSAPNPTSGDGQTLNSENGNYRTLYLSRLPSLTTLSHLVAIIRTNGKPLESISLSRQQRGGRGAPGDSEITAHVTFTSPESCNEFYNYLLTNTAQGNKGPRNNRDKPQIRLQPGGEKCFVEIVGTNEPNDGGGSRINVTAEIEKYGARRNFMVKNLPEGLSEADLLKLILPKGNYGLDDWARWRWIEKISVEQVEVNGRMTTLARINTAGITTAVNAKIKILKEYNPRSNTGRGGPPSVRIDYTRDECEGSLMEIPEWVVDTIDGASDRGSGGAGGYHGSHSHTAGVGPRRHGRGGGGVGGGGGGGNGGGGRGGGGNGGNRGRRQSSGGWP